MQRIYSTLVSLVVLVFWTSIATVPASAQDLPPINLSYASYAVASDGSVLNYFGEQRRVELLSTGLVPKHLIEALVATEDREFYNHDGVSLKSIGRAIWKTLTGNTQGGSTLTMQLARNLFLSREKTLSRKLKEIELARELEKKYSKDQILLLYLNTVYFGRGAYGIWTAAQEYFSKTPDRLSLLESAFLIGLLKAPSAYDPAVNPQRALVRRNEVLHNLVELKRLSESDYRKLKAESIGLHPRENIGRYFIEQVRKDASAILARLGTALQSDAFKITTTLDPVVQHAADEAVREQWRHFPRDMRDAQVGLVTIDVGTGAITAMVGGNPSADQRGLNRAIQIRRQPGSAFKPFLYGTLLDSGATLATPYLDAPLVADSGTAWEWRPGNDDDTYSGHMIPMREVIRRSLNLVAAHAMVEGTTPEAVATFAQRCGITSQLPNVPSLALGTGEVSPLEMASAISTFARGGMRTRPFTITKIEDRNHRVLYIAVPDTSRAMDSTVAWMMTDALQAVVDSGTGTAVRSFYTGPAAGKTGTTQRSADAWFVGYTPALCAAVWCGYDSPEKTLHGGYQYGGAVCAPIWGRLMAQLAQTGRYGTAEPFHRPSSIVEVPICLLTGLRATSSCPRVHVYPFAANRIPDFCDRHPGDPLPLPANQ